LLRSGQGAFVSVEYVIDPDHKLELTESSGEFVARIVDIPGTVRPQVVCGTLEGSLFESMARTGEQPELAMQIAEIFAWDIDFYRDPQPGDRFCLLVEKKEYDNGGPATYQRVLAAKYDNAGTMYDAYLFKNPDGEEHYYSSDGQSLQAAFLRSPLKFDARISSRFSHRRLHPVFGVYRAHLGTDYAAPMGTSVQAVADGRVIFSGLSGGSGNLITLQHANGYATQYLHLSKRLVRKGDRVKQGQRIGLVGMTGLASGPHVDIRIQKNGHYMNWETLKLPRQSRIAAASLQAFEVVRDRFTAMLASGPDSGTRLALSDTAPTAAR
jgi:murein DD-endopeptidase MepM/ murein hydrolase activator NlpD